MRRFDSAKNRTARAVILLFVSILFAAGCRKDNGAEKAPADEAPPTPSPLAALTLPTDVLDRFAELNRREAEGEALSPDDSSLFDRSEFPGAERLAVRPVIPVDAQPVFVTAQALEKHACFDLDAAKSDIEGDIVKLQIPLQSDPEGCARKTAIREKVFDLGRLERGPKLIALFLGDGFHIGRRIVVRTEDEAEAENEYEPLRDRYMRGNPQERAETAVALFDLKTKRAYTFLFKQLDMAPATTLIAFQRHFHEVMAPQPDPQALGVMLSLLEYPSLRTVVSRNLKKVGQTGPAVAELAPWLEKEKNPARREELVQLLESLTGERRGGDVEKWKAWLNEKGADTKK